MNESRIEEWRQAGVIDAAAADRIRAFEAARRSPARLRWPVLVALAAGGLMVTAGVLLFVAAHWDTLAPIARLGLLLGVVALFHGAGAAVTERFPPLATTLHAIGTATLGAAILLAGQAFHLESNWAHGYLLWAIGAWAGYLLLRSWPQALFAALLTPTWLVAEWVNRVSRAGAEPMAVPAAGLLLLTLVYLLGDGRGRRSAERTMLGSVGAVVLIPLAVITALAASHGPHGTPTIGAAEHALWWSIAIGLPLVLAIQLRGREAWLALPAAAWAITGALLGRHAGVLPFLWGVAGAILLTASGAYDGSRRRINLGMAGFAVTVVAFYFSNVLDKFGRATSLMLGGALFLLLGWGLERLRRRLVQGTRSDPA